MIRLVALVTLAILPVLVKAQRFQGGVKAGIASTQISGDGYDGFNKVGVNAGVFVRTPISDRLSAQLEMLYLQKGSIDPTDPDNNKFSYYRIRLGYIELPLMFQFKLSRFQWELGPSFGVLTHSLEEDENGEVPNPAFDFKPYEIAWNAGMYFYLTDRLSANVRYSRSFLPIADEFRFIQANFGFFGGSYNTVLHFTLNYQITSPD